MSLICEKLSFFVCKNIQMSCLVLPSQCIPDIFITKWEKGTVALSKVVSNLVFVCILYFQSLS